MWQAMLPIITSEMNGTKKLLVSSTPTSLDTIFSKIWHSPEGKWSKHKITIYDAVEQGLKADIETLKSIVNDDLIWNTEYCCEFCSGAGTAFPPEWLIGIEDSEDFDGNFYLGFDVARSGDFSAFVILKRNRDGRVKVVAIHTLRDTPYNKQLEFVKKLNSQYKFFGGYTDAVGIGAMLAEEIQRTVNPKIKPFIWNGTNKTTLHDNVRTLLQNK